MANQIAKTSIGPGIPAKADPGMVRMTQWALSGAQTHGAITVLLPGKEIAPGERQKAEARLSTLRRSLDHRDNQELAKAVARLMASYASSRGSDDEARATVTAYVAVLADLPPWAVSEAAQAWARGGYGATTSAFAPSAAELHKAAAYIVRSFSREAEGLERVLTARVEPITAEERARVSAGFDKLKTDLTGRLTDTAKAA